MSKTIRLSEKKARSETLSKRADSDKEKKPPVAPIVSEKKLVDHGVTVPAIKAINNSEKKETVRQKPATIGKATPITSSTATQSPIPVSGEDARSQLLRRTKTTALALAQLEKGIEFIHRKDFKKAIVELQSLIEKYKNETDITASARNYLDICRRGEARQKKTPPATQNQTYAMGVLEHNKTNYDKAVTYFRQSLETYPRADYIYYSIAASLALKGDGSAAVENLRKAVELNRDSLVYAKNDPDFVSLESNKEFLELVGITVTRHR